MNDVPVQDPCRRRSVEAWVDGLGADDCWALVASTPVGRVGFIRSSRPIVVPVNHVVDHRTVVFRTDDESILGGLSTGERVAFEVDGHDDRDRTGWSVLIAGELVGMDRVDRRLTPAPVPWAPSAADHWWRIRTDSVSGRRIHRHRRDAGGHFLPAMPPD